MEIRDKYQFEGHLDKSSAEQLMKELGKQGVRVYDTLSTKEVTYRVRMPVLDNIEDRVICNLPIASTVSEVASFNGKPCISRYHIFGESRLGAGEGHISGTETFLGYVEIDMKKRGSGQNVDLSIKVENACGWRGGEPVELCIKIRDIAKGLYGYNR